MLIVGTKTGYYSMEKDAILQATFFSDCLDFTASVSANANAEGRRYMPRAEREVRRAEWFAKSLSALAGKDIVCVDPDNGLIVPSAKGRPKENKYVLPEELAAYYAQGSTVIYYQHKARRKDPVYAQQLKALLERDDLPGASGLALKFTKVSQRYYMFVVQPQHKEAIAKAVERMLSTAWGNHFCLLA